MPVQCPTCAKVNPANAAYCYYDGRALSQASHSGPVGVGTAPFPTPFVFPDGCSCSTFNQFALACDKRWNDSKKLLAGGTLQWFFSTLGRGDLAAAAAQAATEADLDLGLARLLERLPADADTLRPKLGVPVKLEDLGTLTPGTDTHFDLVIANQGMLVLRGTIMCDCDWLSFGERQGGTGMKLFQTRDTYTLPIQVLGSRLRAGQKPIEAQIVIDSNGGRTTVMVRASVPVRPFPAGPDSNLLAGARSPRELAVKAKAHPREAAPLFEQGAVKAWYESNGWTYPVQGTQGRGVGGVQQFFEALGLTKPPKLEIDTERITCRARVGKRITKNVTVTTTEKRFVHAAAFSSAEWIIPQPGQPDGESITLPLRIEVPPPAGETLQAQVTVVGNGGQRFVVPVTLTVMAGAADDDAPTGRGGRRLLIVAVGGLLLAASAILLALYLNRPVADPPRPLEPETTVTKQPPPGPPTVWWDTLKGTQLAARANELTAAAPALQPVVTALSVPAPGERYKGYEQLAAKLPELARDAKVKAPLGRFVTECCVHDPSDLGISPLLRAVAAQLPKEGVAYRPEEKADEVVEGASFWLRVAVEAMKHSAARPERVRGLRNEIGKAFAFTLDSDGADDLGVQVERLLAQRCYRNILPTAAQSVERALTIRDVLIARCPQHLGAEAREPIDIELLDVGLAKEPALWPKLAPLLKACLDSADPAVLSKVVLVYEQADADRAREMEPVLAGKWDVAANPGLSQAAKVKVIRKRLSTSGRESRLTAGRRRIRVEGLTRAALEATAGQKPEAVLQETVRLTHAATLECLLLHPREDDDRFDQLAARVPEIEGAQSASGGDTRPASGATGAAAPPQGPPAIRVKLNGFKPYVVQGRLTPTHEIDPRRGSFCQRYSVPMTAGAYYTIAMQGVTFTYPRVEVRTAAGAPLESDYNYRTANVSFFARFSGVHYVVATTNRPGQIGQYVLQIVQNRGGAMLGDPFGAPGGADNPGQVKPETKDRQTELANLAAKSSEDRLAAFVSLAGVRDLRPQHAHKVARYVLTIDQQSEFDAAVGKLPSVAESMSLLLGLADVITGDKVAQERAEAVVAGVLGQQVRFARDEDWRTGCRRLLLQRTLELTAPPSTAADQAAEVLGELYKEQALALGVAAAEVQAQRRPARVLDRLIHHVAAKTAERQPPPPDRDYLTAIDRQLRAAEFVADNDLEHLVRLQRIWARVLATYLQEKAPAQARAMAAVAEELAAGDRSPRGALEHLRAGEQKIVRVWATAREQK